MSETAPVEVPCETCGTEGRLYYNTGRYDDQGPIIGDEGPCPDCDGTGRRLIEDVEPITLEDLIDA